MCKTEYKQQNNKIGMLFHSAVPNHTYFSLNTLGQGGEKVKVTLWISSFCNFYYRIYTRFPKLDQIEKDMKVKIQFPCKILSKTFMVPWKLLDVCTVFCTGMFWNTVTPQSADSLFQYQAPHTCRVFQKQRFSQSTQQLNKVLYLISNQRVVINTSLNTFLLWEHLSASAPRILPWLSWTFSPDFLHFLTCFFLRNLCFL